MPRKMFWRRFSLRAMLVAFTLLSIAFAILSRPIADYRAEVATAEWIEELGGEVEWKANVEPVGFDGILERVGLGFVFQRVSKVAFIKPGPKIDRDALKRIVRLNEITNLDIDYAQDFYDVDVPVLAELTKLESLSIRNARITTTGANQIVTTLPALDFVMFPSWFSGCNTVPTKVEMYVFRNKTLKPIPVTGHETIEEAREKIAILKKALQLAIFPPPNSTVRPEDLMAESMEQLNSRLLDLGAEP